MIPHIIISCFFLIKRVKYNSQTLIDVDSDWSFCCYTDMQLVNTCVLSFARSNVSTWKQLGIVKYNQYKSDSIFTIIGYYISTIVSYKCTTESE